jgi:hypothetical protein
MHPVLGNSVRDGKAPVDLQLFGRVEFASPVAVQDLLSPEYPHTNVCDRLRRGCLAFGSELYRIF